MQFENAPRATSTTIKAPAINPFLNLYVSLGLKLEVALLWIGAKVLIERFFYIDWVGVVPFD